METNRLLAQNVMSTDVIFVGPGHSIAHAAQIMLDNQVSGLPVIGDDGSLIGMLTEGDLMRRSEICGSLSSDNSAVDPDDDEQTALYIRNNSWCVKDVMSRDIMSAPPDSPLALIANLMERHDCKRIPIVRNNIVVGIVSRADLLRAIVSAAPEPIILGDDALRIAIMARLSTDVGLEDFDLQATVEDGHATLIGTVETQNQREAARVAADSVRGCKSLTNEITLDASARPKGS